MEEVRREAHLMRERLTAKKFVHGADGGRVHGWPGEMFAAPQHSPSCCGAVP